MGFSPDHPGPDCPDCHGEGHVPAPWDDRLDSISHIPCERCKAREYEAWCGENVVDMTPGHPCRACHRPAESHPRATRCKHRSLTRRCVDCAETEAWREALRAVLAALPKCTHPNLDGQGPPRCGRTAVIRDKNGNSFRCEECLDDNWRKHRVDDNLGDQQASEAALRKAIALLAAYDAKHGSGT